MKSGRKAGFYPRKSSYSPQRRKERKVPQRNSTALYFLIAHNAHQKGE
jgi:hypothetical protein